MWCMPPRLMVFCYSSLNRLRHHSSLCDSFGSSFFYTLLYGTVIYFMIKLENFFFFLPKNSYLEPFFYPHGTGVHAGSLYGITILRTLCSVQGQVFWSSVIDSLGFPGDSAVKNLPASASMGWTHGSGRSPGEGNGNPLQCSCLENPRDGRAWWAAVYGVAQSRTQLKRHSSSSSKEKIEIDVSITLSIKLKNCNSK